MKKTNLVTKVICLFILLSFVLNDGFSQNKLAQFIESKKQIEDFRQVDMFTPVTYEPLFNTVKTGVAFTIDILELQQIMADKNATLTLKLPALNGKVYELELARVNLFAGNFKLTSYGNIKGEEVDYTPGLYYRGIIKGDDGSFAAVSFFNDGLMGLFSDNTGNYNLGQVKDTPGLYVLYNDKDEINKPLIDCGSVMQKEEGSEHNKGGNPSPTSVNCKVVNCYYECDFAMYQAFSSNTTTVANYLTGAFNVEATLYFNEGITIAISQIVVWTVTDPEAALTSTSTVNSSFATRTGSAWNGDMAQFLTTRNLGGGIAQGFNGLCNKSQAHSSAEIYTTYSPFPTYSWTIMVMTHEMGHLLGSRHTHACVWNGNNTAIDGCSGGVEGTCSLPGIPSGGGTIMSYCHIQGVGINFNNGFGPQPGALLLANVNNAVCLTGSSASAPTGLTTTTISNNSATVNWAPVSGATQYTVEYKVTTAGSYTSLGNFVGTTANLTGLLPTTNYTWRVQADCSPFTSLTFNTLSNPGCGVPTSLTTSNLKNVSAKVSWSSFSNATSYTVRYKVFGTSTFKYYTTSNAYKFLLNLLPSTKYTWSVKTTCNDLSVTAYSAAKNFTTKSNAAPTTYCVANGSNSTIESLSNVTFGSINNTSGDNGGYADFTALSTNIVPGSSYGISVSLTKANPGDNEAVSVWIDFNRDGDFTDANELAYTSNSINALFNGTINVPSTAAVGFSRMRVTCEFGATPVPCGTYQYGETEDYLVNITTTPLVLDESRIEYNDFNGLDFIVFPNPASTNIQLQINANDFNFFDLTIISLTGQIVKNVKLKGENVSVDISDIKNGFYQLIMTDLEGNRVVKKLIKN